MRPIRNNNPQNKKKSNFFEYFIRQSGEDFLSRENIVNLRRRSTMFFRDMANGSFDLEKHGQYLSNDYLLNVMVNEALMKVNYYVIHCKFADMALQSHPECNSDSVQLAIRADHDSLEAYTCVYNCLLNLRMSKNLGYLATAANQMRHVKYSL